MGDCTTATERIFLARESEVGVAVVFRDPFEFVPFDEDTVSVNVVGEEVGTFLELPGLEFVDAFITGLCLASDRLLMGLCCGCRRFCSSIGVAFCLVTLATALPTAE
ncbi:hypothetical protein ACFFQF_22115 [Haladaptatus pallidirubidus]|uniref:hypothetical protein n=1 Tax=Haladaptatus pallidirubidus TaxID=1008152 RepID=UPI0035E60700